MTEHVVLLGEIASARSGDKGADANIGVWTHDVRTYEFLREHLTSKPGA